MRRARWIIPHHPQGLKPVIYHCIARVVDRRFVLGPDEKEKLRTFMRMHEAFSGNRILAYCFMSNHIHLLLEITPPPPGSAGSPEGLSDESLLTRLRAIYSEAQVAAVAKELTDARKSIMEGTGNISLVQNIHERFTYRMHNLSEFMKSFLQRYTQWHNAKFDRSGHLWEDRFKSVIVEDGAATKTIAAYIDLNPVRAGLAEDPAEYRWSSYGEAIGDGTKGNGKTARAGLVRAMEAHRGMQADSSYWSKGISTEYRKRLLLGAGEMTQTQVDRSGKTTNLKMHKGMTAEQLETARAALREAEEKQTSGLAYAKMLRSRIRYFTDGAVIGSREFVNSAFESARERFGPKRKDGARKFRGNGEPARGILWSARDLRKNH